MRCFMWVKQFGISMFKRQKTKVHSIHIEQQVCYNKYIKCSLAFKLLLSTCEPSISPINLSGLLIEKIVIFVHGVIVLNWIYNFLNNFISTFNVLQLGLLCTDRSTKLNYQPTCSC